MSIFYLAAGVIDGVVFTGDQVADFDQFVAVGLELFDDGGECLRGVFGGVMK